MQGVAKLTYEIIISFLYVIFLSCKFLDVGCTTWLKDIFSYIYEQWYTFFFLARFWMLELELEFLYFIPVGKLSFNE